jgi:site-specific DNA-cytosine methylase
MKDGYVVLSCFDGASCWRVALDELGIPVKQYYASEIDPYAMTVASNNYLDTIQIGDITKVDGHLLPKIDLLIGGSPCQGFSFAGKQLNFEDPRSKLFFEFVRLLKECKPKFFFLENVRMKKEHQDVISKYLGVEPIKLNSNRVSAQSRPRIYWTNITTEIRINIENNETVFDILDTPKFHNNYPNWLLGNFCNKSRLSRLFYADGKASCLTASMHKGNQSAFIKDRRDYIHKLTPIECERLQTLPDNYTIGVSNSQRYKMLGNGWTVAAVKEFFKHLPPVEDLDLY